MGSKLEVAASPIRQCVLLLQGGVGLSRRGWSGLRCFTQIDGEENTE